MAKLKFKYCTMDAGKTTEALQIAHQYETNGKLGMLITLDTRKGGKMWSRLGAEKDAVLIDNKTDIHELVTAKYDLLESDTIVDYVIIDEVQFLTREQVGQLVALVDDWNINVHAYGLLTDFQGNQFEGSSQLIADADEKTEISVKALCWCGRKATHNARTVDGYRVASGEQIQEGYTGYEPLCRKHFYDGMTKKVIEDGLENGYVEGTKFVREITTN